MMNNIALPIQNTLSKIYFKKPVSLEKIENFKNKAKELLQNLNTQESEEYNKNFISDFLKTIYYSSEYFINTRGNTDLVIHNGKTPNSPVGVIIETKRPSNKTEMPNLDNLNVKSIHELVLYYMQERENNIYLKHLIATNGYQWFVFDARIFEAVFYQNRDFQKQYQDFKKRRLTGTTTEFFYTEIVQKFIEKEPEQSIKFSYFDLNKYKAALNSDKDDNKNPQMQELIEIYKLLSPQHLLKLNFKNDSNSLDKGFYKELLHIVGLNETKEGGRKIIKRKDEAKRDSGSLIENAIQQLKNGGKLQNLRDKNHFGKNDQERLFQVGLELCLTWINRILFLKLLESQLLSYHKKDKSYAFLNSEKIFNYDKLNSLFFEVLAKERKERTENLTREFDKIPYLNSSLFEPASIEMQTLSISNLDDNQTMPVLAATVLKDEKGKTQTGELKTLHYFFQFLDAYDFSSENKEIIKEKEKTLITASVLGLIFEKINGYQEGSFFTPGFITMYIARETLRKAVLTKFNQDKGWDCKNLNDLYNKIEDTEEANQKINSLKICDPTVGSGHFLVSALNELIAIKSELGILCDNTGKKLKGYQAEVQDDELVISDDKNISFVYDPTSRESKRIQKALFYEKQTLIENCLFGVDINHNSVKICRLRLWIELLKNAYYKTKTELETLPNIDINIQCGNSLNHFFSFKENLGKITQKSGETIENYRQLVKDYYHTRSKEKKQEIEKQIETIKKSYSERIINFWSADRKKLSQLGLERDKKHHSQLFDSKLTKEQVLQQAKKIQKLMEQESKLAKKIEDKENNQIYKNALEWRFEFPEALDSEGNFVGFDVILGNPPYIRQEEIKEWKELFSQKFEVYKGTADIFTYFVEQGYKLLKENGVFQFIVSNKFARAKYGEALRLFLLQKTTLTHFIDFSELAVFDEATVDACILGFQKKKSSENLLLAYSIQKENFNPASFAKNIPTPNFSQNHLTEDTWFFGSPQEMQLKAKIENIGTPLKDWDLKINYGIKTGYNDAFIINQTKRDELLAADPKSAEIIKPILRGRDIKAYQHRWARLYIITTFPALKIKINDYPAIKKHLLSYGKDRLEQTGKTLLDGTKSRKATGNQWFETQDQIAYYPEFEKEKIIYSEIVREPQFYFDNQKYYAEATSFIITGESLKFLLGLLHSKLITYAFTTFYAGGGLGEKGYRYKKVFLEKLPIPKIPAKEQKPFIQLVDKIIQAKAKNSNADTNELQNKVDKLVYKLYNLTDKEISSKITKTFHSASR